MSLIKRVDLGLRTGIEKAQLPDEAITRSQVVPGSNITIDYLSNHDIKINAVASGGSGTVIGRKTMWGAITINWFSGTTPGTSGQYLYVGADDTVNGNASFRRFYKTMFFAEIKHNWDLDHKDAFMLDLIDARDGVGSTDPVALDCKFKVVGIDTNTIRIYVAIPRWNEAALANWRAGNLDESVGGNSLLGLPGLLANNFKYVLMEGD